MGDGRYLAFQLTDLSLCDELCQVEGVLSNAFIMERLSDRQVRAIIQLIEAVKMLESFLSLHPDVFLPSSIKLHGFRTQTSQDGLSALVFDDPHTGEAVTLDIKPTRDAQPSAEALNAYVVNPDYHAVLSDLVYDVVDGINGWRSVSDPAYVDFERGRVEVM